MIARTAVVAGTATAVSGRVARRQQSKFADQAAEQAPPEEQGAPPPQDQAPPDDDGMAELQQLAELHKQGVLTDEEFAAKKAQILGI
jgi:hypothetical protein